MRRTALTGLALAAVIGSAWADEVTLKNGRKVVGIAREEGDRILVETAIGTVGFRKPEVVAITPGRTALHEYREKAASIRESRNAQDFLDLARWSRANGLVRYVRPNYLRALELEPNLEEARRELGYTLHEGRWMTAAEVRRAEGYMWFDGRWMTELEKELILRRRLAAQEAREAAEEERRRRREEERELRRRATQDYLDRLQEERRRDQDRAARRSGYRSYRGEECDRGVSSALDVLGFLSVMGWRLVPPTATPFRIIPGWTR
ncbi:MAG: hypothetical protein HYY16_08035 [Planctomycetes bacterium]|nr:hypothetical protein [Planctomycetota bacterium]